MRVRSIRTSARPSAPSRAGLVLCGAVVLGLLTGCASTSAPASSGSATSGSDVAQLAAESRETLVDCMVERGWDVVLISGGWEINNLDSSQTDAYEKDQSECRDVSGLDSIPEVPLDDEGLAALFQYEIRTAACLRDRGFDIPEAPSEQTFKDAYVSADPWFAYKFVDPATLGENAWAELQADCPQFGTAE